MPSSTGTLVFNDQKIQAPDIYATESLGVGVSDPTSNLQVVGNAYVSSNLEVGTANLFVDTTTGRVGIGTGSPIGLLDIRASSTDPGAVPTVHIGDAAADAGDYGMVNLVRHATTGGSKCHLSFIRNLNMVAGMGYYNNTDTLGIWNAFSSVTNTPSISIQSNHNVGVGITNPSAKLHVNGTTLGVPGVYAKGSWTSGTGIELGYINTTAYKYHRIVARFYATNPTFQRCNVRIRSREVGQSAFNTSGYESWGSIIKKYAPNSLDYIYNGADGPLVAYYNDTQSANNSDVLLIMDISNVLNGRSQLQFECSYTYGGIGYSRAFGGFHRTTSASIDKIKLYFEQYSSGNTATGSVGDYMIIGYG